MTAINTILAPTWAAVATDTLATDPSDWGAGFLIPKAHFLPTARALFAVTGSVELLNVAFATALRASALAAEDLCSVLPAPLREVHDREMQAVRTLHPEEDDAWMGDAKVYVFGWSDPAGRFVGHCYQAAADFEPLAMDDGLQANPAVFVPLGEANPLKRVRTPLDLCDLTARQQAIERRRRREDQNLIGGHVMLYTLTHHPEAEHRGEDPVVMQVRRMRALAELDVDLAEVRQKGPAARAAA